MGRVAISCALVFALCVAASAGEEEGLVAHYTFEGAEGSVMVTLTADDGDGGVDAVEFIVTVVDRTPAGEEMDSDLPIFLLAVMVLAALTVFVLYVFLQARRPDDEERT